MAFDIGFFAPFIEAPSVAPVKPSATMSGSDTTAIDAFRQGVEIQTDAQRYASALPRFEGDDPDHAIQIVVFGQSSEFVEVTTFSELAKFDPVAFVQNNQTLAFPVVIDDPSYEDPERLGGFIQPLSIAARDMLVSTTEFEAHDVRAQLMDGNESAFHDVNRIVGVIDLREQRQSTDLYIDAANNFGFSSGSVMLSGLFPEDQRILQPFNDSRYLSRSFLSGSIPGTGSYDVASVLVGLSNDTSEYIVDGFMSAGKGFTYDNTPLGTDSLAFGGLRRS